MTKRKHHLMITLAVGFGLIAHYACELWIPSLKGLAPLAGFGANLIWIWTD